MKWSENAEIIEQMIKGSSGELWGTRLESSDHFPLLKHSLELAGNFGTLLDIGCGAGDISRVWKGDYMGVDLPWVIEKVSKVCNPKGCYLPVDLNPSSLISLPSARVILTNAFLDIRDDPHEIFESLLTLNAKIFIVHRQRLSQDSAKIEYRKSYGDSIVPSSIMSWERIYQSVMSSDSESKISLAHWQSDHYTFVVSRE